MILPAALALGAQLIMPVADGVPVLNVERSARVLPSRAV
jgi:hypothetical protein